MYEGCLGKSTLFCGYCQEKGGKTVPCGSGKAVFSAIRSNKSILKQNFRESRSKSNKTGFSLIMSIDIENEKGNSVLFLAFAQTLLVTSPGFFCNDNNIYNILKYSIRTLAVRFHGKSGYLTVILP